VALLDLIPAQATGAALIDVEGLRASPSGRAVIAALRRLGGARWEQLLEVDLDHGVRRVVLAGESTQQGRPLDLDRFAEGRGAALRSIAVELDLPNLTPDLRCHLDDLSQIQPEQLETPGGTMNMARCGQFIILTCCDRPMPTGAERAEVARELERLRETVSLRIPPILWGTVGSELVNRATCERSVIALRGWHSAVIGLDQGLEIRARIRAASSADAPDLEECVSDGITMLAGFPMLSQIGLGGLVDQIEIGRDPQEEKDVLFGVALEPDQVEILMGLLDLLGDEVTL
jgi:hypothetical protein